MMQMNLTKLASAFILSSTLVGCAAMVKSPYEAPAVTIPASFQNSTVLSKQVQADAYADQWWTLFGDTQLNQLIDNVLEKNSDLAVAGMTLKQARLQADLSENQQ